MTAKIWTVRLQWRGYGTWGRWVMVASVALATLLAHGGAHAAGPPPPPATPVCRYCQGPPPPPTPVPTLAPTEVAQSYVGVQLAPTKVHRGKSMQLQITAPRDHRVTLTLHYHSGKPHTVHSHIAHTGQLLHTWHVPHSAPLGHGTLHIAIAEPGKWYVTTVPFTVVK